jgi:hypothetical protein
MPLYLNNGKLLLGPGGLATSSSCCCVGCGCTRVIWRIVYGECTDRPTDTFEIGVESDCYSYYTYASGVGGCENCGGGAQCNIYARVSVAGNAPGPIEYLQSEDPDVWGPVPPGGFCDCPDSFSGFTVECEPCSNCAPGECCIANYDENGTFLGTFSCEPAGAACGCYFVLTSCLPGGPCNEQFCFDNTPGYEFGRTFAYLQNAQDYADSLDLPDGCIALATSTAGYQPDAAQECVDYVNGLDFPHPDALIACCRGVSEDFGNPLP